ncbi:MAG: metallophosphoesterase [Anaerofustis sp.]
MKTIAVFSDIHSNRQALSAILADMEHYDFDEMICLGDVLGLGPEPSGCLEDIRSRPVRMLMGNHELYSLCGGIIDEDMHKEEQEHHRWVSAMLSEDQKQFLRECSLSYRIETNNKTICFEHFLQNEHPGKANPFAALSVIKDGKIADHIKNSADDMICFGHEHRSFTIQVDHKLLLDVGSSGCRSDDHTFYTILTIDGDEIEIEKKDLIYDRDSFMNTVRKTNYPHKEIVARLFFGFEV